MTNRVTQNQLQSQRTLENIRNAIEELLQEKEYDSFTIKDICSRANIAVGTFYKYYDSKEDVFTDRYHKMDEYFNTEVAQKMTENSLRKNLILFADCYRKRITNINVARQILKARLSGTSEAAKTRNRPMYEILDHLFEQGQKQNEVRQDIPFTQCSDQFMILLRGYSFNDCVYGVVDQNEAFHSYLEIWLDGMLIKKKD